MNSTDPIKVFISNREWKCDDCGENLGRKAWITLQRDKGALCLTCADLDRGPQRGSPAGVAVT